MAIFGTAKIAIAGSETLNLPRLISRKILDQTDKCSNFYTVFHSLFLAKLNLHPISFDIPQAFEAQRVNFDMMRAQLSLRYWE